MDSTTLRTINTTNNGFNNGLNNGLKNGVGSAGQANTAVNVRDLNASVRQESAFIVQLLAEINKVMVGQEALVERVLIGLLADGHILLEGVPGLAKTLLVKTVAQAIDGGFARIQFTPDLLPADLIGTQIYNPRTAEFSVHSGPIFSNLILADEINRAPAKVQSALLEAMQERQVTIGDTTFKMSDLFLVLATQNPDRAGRDLSAARGAGRSLHAQGEGRLPLAGRGAPDRRPHDGRWNSRRSGPWSSRTQLLHAREVVKQVYVDPKIKEYVLDLVIRTRQPGNNGLGDLKSLIAFGASPRASINLILAARAHAFLNGRGYVTPEDVKQIAPDVLRHRIITTYEAEAENITSDQIVRRILDYTPVP